MTDTIEVPRELLEQIAADCEHDNDLYWISKELRALLAQPASVPAKGEDIEFIVTMKKGPMLPSYDSKKSGGDE